MAIITAILGTRDQISAECQIDSLTLTSDERASPHFAKKTSSGRLVKISLPRGTDIQDGDVLEHGEGHAVIVVAAAEDLLFISPAQDRVQWWAACYQLGNLHRPVRFQDGGILTPFDPMVRQLLCGMDVLVERGSQPFIGKRFNAATGGHGHGLHDHAHHDAHEHSHHHHPHGATSSNGAGV